MLSQKRFSRRSIAWVAVSILAMSDATIPVRAQNTAAGYMLLVASSFLCDAGDASACPAVVKSAHGDSYEMSGAGTFNPENKSVTATGTFTHRSANGNALATGIWIASELVQFDLYGAAPGALMQQGLAFGPPHFGSRRLPTLALSMPTGGLAVLRIRLLPMWGPSRTAVLQVNCALGKVPEERQTEGIRLSLEPGGGEFDQEISGRTMFVLTRLGTSSAAKPPTTEGETNSVPTQVQP
jgi:hypothetical protein